MEDEDQKVPSYTVTLDVHDMHVLSAVLLEAKQNLGRMPRGTPGLDRLEAQIMTIARKLAGAMR